MPLAAGMRLGPYEVLALIGAGGMGEVYKARDTRLDRTVAIKVLPAAFSSDPDRRARFEREARVVSGLNHPHICTLHDVGEVDGRAFLVMEHLAGETLEDRLRRGPLPLEQALTIAIQIADALAVSHRLGIVHRDLKPANVMLTKDGVKLLDFGLAKLTGHGEQPAAALASTVTTHGPSLTGEGAILGTLQYMAPEQLEGKDVDERTDLWALGAILHEMIAGSRAFEATSAASLIGAILERTPPALATSKPLTPPGVDRVVRQCLAKSPDDRPDTAHDVARELRWMQEAASAAVAASQPRPLRGLRLGLTVAGGLALASAGAAGTWLLRPPTRVAPIARVTLELSPADELDAGGLGSLPSTAGGPPPTAGGSRTALAWTPDGQALVFVGRRAGVQQLYVRRLDASEAHAIADTEGAQVPAVSPDGQSIAFWAKAGIRKVLLSGGPVTEVVPNSALGLQGGPPKGLTWDGRDGLYVASLDGRIWAVPAQGLPTAVTSLGESEVAHVLPSALPRGGGLLYTVRKRVHSWGDEEIVVQPVPGGSRKVLLRDAADAHYLPTGHLVFLRRGMLFAVPFDLERLRIGGAPIAVLDGVAQALTANNTGDVTGAGQFAVAPTGTLAWVPGPIVPPPERALVTVDFQGRTETIPAPRLTYAPWVRISPDGRRLAVSVRSLTETSLFTYDLDRGTLSPLARTGEANRPVWSPDGQRLAFNWLANGRMSLADQPADGVALPHVLVLGNVDPSSWAPNGRQLVAVRANQEIVNVALGQGGDAEPPPGLALGGRAAPAVSPDGRWLAYAANGSGRFEVYVQPYGEPGAPAPVSVDGGNCPAWDPRGRTVFFVGQPDAAGQRSMMAADFAPGPPTRIGRPRRLFTIDNSLHFYSTPVRAFDVAPDGRRFYVARLLTPPPKPVVTDVRLVLNWLEELKAKVPVE